MSNKEIISEIRLEEINDLIKSMDTPGPFGELSADGTIVIIETTPTYMPFELESSAFNLNTPGKIQVLQQIGTYVDRIALPLKADDKMITLAVRHLQRKLRHTAKEKEAIAVSNTLERPGQEGMYVRLCDDSAAFEIRIYSVFCKEKT